MAEPLPEEIIQKARELVLCSRSKQYVAIELGIGLSTVHKYTKDIPSARKDGQFSRELIQQIREEVLVGKSKYQIAKDRGLKFGAVYYHTMDLPNQVYREDGLVGKTLDLLKELLKDGYVVSTGENTCRLRRLKRYLPMIQRSQVGRGAVYYLSDKNKIALQSMIQRKNSKIISYQELSNMSRVFDIKLSKNERKSVLSQKHR